MQAAVPLLQPSDARTKANVRQLTDVVDKFVEIRGVSFERIDPDDPILRPGRQRELGVVAQEVEKVFPELVSAHGKENPKGVHYSGLSGVLLEATKELKAHNDELRSQLGELRFRIEAVEAV